MLFSDRAASGGPAGCLPLRGKCAEAAPYLLLYGGLQVRVVRRFLITYGEAGEFRACGRGQRAPPFGNLPPLKRRAKLLLRFALLLED